MSRASRFVEVFQADPAAKEKERAGCIQCCIALTVVNRESPYSGMWHTADLSASDASKTRLHGVKDAGARYSHRVEQNTKRNGTLAAACRQYIKPQTRRSPHVRKYPESNTTIV
jgi:hypothetical protein